MKEPEPGSPFLGIGDEDARPSAAEYLRRRAEEDRRASGARWGLLLSMLAGAVLSAGIAVAFGVGWGALLPALGWSLAGGVAGVLAGATVAVCSWAVLVSQAKTAGPFKPGLVDGNSWDAMTVWVAAWAGIGVAVGAGFGAAHGALGAMPEARPEPWAYMGSAAGLLAGVATFLLTRRGET